MKRDTVSYRIEYQKKASEAYGGNMLDIHKEMYHKQYENNYGHYRLGEIITRRKEGPAEYITVALKIQFLINQTF